MLAVNHVMIESWKFAGDCFFDLFVRAWWHTLYVGGRLRTRDDVPGESGEREGGGTEGESV